jgi:hypothetical protein
MVVYQRSYAVESGVNSLLWKGEDDGEARSWARAAEIAKTIIAEILAHPDLLAARTFSELHDHCDATALGSKRRFWIPAAGPARTRPRIRRRLTHSLTS